MTTLAAVILFAAIPLQAAEPAPQAPAAEAPKTEADRALSRGSASSERRQGEAQPAKKVSPKEYFKMWLKGLEQSAVQKRYRPMRSQAVASVRGENQGDDSPNQLYWKGSLEQRFAELSKKQREELRKAVQSIVDGKLDEGKAKLEEFKKNHPKSKLKSDIAEAENTLEMLRKEQPAQEAAPDKK